MSRWTLVVLFGAALVCSCRAQGNSASTDEATLQVHAEAQRSKAGHKRPSPSKSEPYHHTKNHTPGKDYDTKSRTPDYDHDKGYSAPSDRSDYSSGHHRHHKESDEYVSDGGDGKYGNSNDYQKSPGGGGKYDSSNDYETSDGYSPYPKPGDLANDPLRWTALSGPAPASGRAANDEPRLDPDGVSPDWQGETENGNTTRAVKMPRVRSPATLGIQPNPGRAVCPNDPPYKVVPADSTVCKLSSGCTAWFISKNLMVTAGHCVTNFGAANYSKLTPEEPGKVCCRVLADGSCNNNALFNVRAWVTTRGYFGGRPDNFEDANDGAVLLVEPATHRNIKPKPLRLKSFVGAGVPSLPMETSGYPCEDTRPCDNIPNEVGCDATITCKERREWRSTQKPENTPTTDGQPLMYLGSVCGGHSGGTLVDTTDDRAFGILVSGPCGCDAKGQARTAFSQIVNRGLDQGVWIDSLVEELVPAEYPPYSA